MKCVPVLHEHKTVQERQRNAGAGCSWRWQIYSIPMQTVCLLLKKCIALQNANFSVPPAKNTYSPHKYFPALKVCDSWRGNEEKRSSRVLLRLLQLLKSSSWSQDIQMFRVQLGSNSPGLDPQPSMNGATGRYQLRNVGNVRFCRSWICRNLPHYVFHWKYLVSFSQTRLLLNLQMMQLHLEQWSLGWLTQSVQIWTKSWFSEM